MVKHLLWLGHNVYQEDQTYRIRQKMFNGLCKQTEQYYKFGDIKDWTCEDDILKEYHGLGMIRSIMNIMRNMKG